MPSREEKLGNILECLYHHCKVIIGEVASVDNDDQLRKNIYSSLHAKLERMKANRTIYDGTAICDERNNSPVIVDSNCKVAVINFKLFPGVDTYVIQTGIDHEGEFYFNVYGFDPYTGRETMYPYAPKNPSTSPVTQNAPRVSVREVDVDVRLPKLDRKSEFIQILNDIRAAIMHGANFEQEVIIDTLWMTGDHQNITVVDFIDNTIERYK